MDSLDFLKLHHVQNGTLFLTYAKTLAFTESQIRALLSSYPKGYSYVIAFDQSDIKNDKTVIIKQTDSNSKHTGTYIIKDWDSFVITIDCYVDLFEDAPVKELSYKNIAHLACLKVGANDNSVRTLLKHVSQLNHEQVSKSMVNQGTMEDWIDYLTGVKNAYKQQTNTNSDGNTPF